MTHQIVKQSHALTLRARNYRALRGTHWSPTGVCVVVGPNGAGKTTLFTLLEFLRNAYLRGAPSAIDQIGGVYRLRSWASQDDQPVLVGLTVGDLRWELQLSAKGPTLSHRLGEQVLRAHETILTRAPLADRLIFGGVERTVSDDDQRVGIRIVADADSPADLAPLIHALTGLRVYRSYNLWGLQVNGSRHSSDVYLHPTGQNAFTVLRNWRDRRDLKPQYDFVVNRLKLAFPYVFEDLDFHTAGLTTTVDLVDPTWHEPFPVALAPDGWITGLLHLMAIAGGQEGSLVAIDDFGNDLHPFAIRALVTAIREWAEERNVIVCMATHSPVVLDEFKEEPASVFVMEHEIENRPIPLTELFESDWLARFSLGRLYEHGEFGGQQPRRVVEAAV